MTDTTTIALGPYTIIVWHGDSYRDAPVTGNQVMTCYLPCTSAHPDGAVVIERHRFAPELDHAAAVAQALVLARETIARERCYRSHLPAVTP